MILAALLSCFLTDFTAQAAEKMGVPTPSVYVLEESEVPPAFPFTYAGWVKTCRGSSAECPRIIYIRRDFEQGMDCAGKKLIAYHETCHIALLHHITTAKTADRMEYEVDVCLSRYLRKSEIQAGEVNQWKVQEKRLRARARASVVPSSRP